MWNRQINSTRKTNTKTAVIIGSILVLHNNWCIQFCFPYLFIVSVSGIVGLQLMNTVAILIGYKLAVSWLQPKGGGIGRHMQYVQIVD